jgi:hypothetical protein
MSRGTARNPPTRRVSSDAVLPHLHVFCEGEMTEDRYFKYWYRIYRSAVRLTIDEFHGTPLSLVQRAVTYQGAERRNEARGRGSAADQVWCVFDVDEHPAIPDAIDLANRSGIRVAISNPCIELWFLIHFESQTAFIDRRDAQRRAYAHMKCGKAVTEESLQLLGPNTDGAKERALSLDEKHVGDRSPPHSNPSSQVWALVDQIRRRAPPPRRT